MSGIESLKAELAQVNGSGGGQVQPSAKESAVFETLTIEKRVLEMPSRTIAIRNISTISVGKIARSRSVLVLLIGIAAALYALSSIAKAATQATPLSEIALGILSPLAVAIACLLLYFRPQDKTSYLTITTSDGGRTLFSGPDLNVLHQVRSILTEKINAEDESAVFNVDFEDSVIETVNAGSINIGALMPADHNNVVATSPATEIAATKIPGAHRPEPVSGAAPGAGNAVVARPGGPRDPSSAMAVTPINYGEHLKIIDEWRQFYAQHAETRHIEHRLTELEHLMKTGTPTDGSRLRLRDLVIDLSTILQGYPAMVQVLQGIARLAGF